VAAALADTNASAFTVNVTAEGSIDAVSVSLPAETAEVLKEAGLPLVISGAAGTLTLDADTFAQISEDGTKAVTIAIGKAGSLNEAQQTAAGENAVYDLTILVGDTVFAGDFEGTVNVSLPYTHPAGIAPADISDYELKVYYLKDDGTSEYVGTAVYEDGFATFAAPHFSAYYIAAEEQDEPEEPPAGAPTVTIGLKGPASVKAGKDVVFEVTAANTVNLGNLKFNVQASGLSFKSAEAVTGRLYSDANSAAVTWGYTDVNTGLTTSGETTVLRLTFTAGAAGAAGVTLTNLQAAGIVVDEDEDADAVYCNANAQGAAASVTVKEQLAFDINGDDKEDLLDLSLAQYYYRLTSDSPRWDERAAAADVYKEGDSDGRIDLGDLIVIYRGVK
jgi:hypothetical protein